MDRYENTMKIQLIFLVSVSWLPDRFGGKGRGGWGGGGGWGVAVRMGGRGDTL